MSLIFCPECQKSVSDRANTCPHCGYPIREMFEEIYLDDFEIENGVLKKYIGKNKVVNIPKSINRIGDKAFISSEIEAVNIPNTVTEIGESSFWNCSKITSISIPDSVKKIGNNAFACCDNLKNVSIPNDIESIGNGTFSRCRNLQGTIESHILFLGNHLNPYLIAYKLTSKELEYYDVTINRNCRFIHSDAFSDSKIKNIKFEPNSCLKTVCDSAFEYCETPSLVFPNTLCNIEAHAFAQSKISTIELSNNIEYIPFMAFYNSELRSIKIPENVKTIEMNAFLDCQRLLNVEMSESVSLMYPNQGTEGTFNGCPGNLCVCAPKNSYAQKFAKDNRISFKEL